MVMIGVLTDGRNDRSTTCTTIAPKTTKRNGMHWDAQGNATPARKRNASGRLNKVAKNGLKGQNCYPLNPAQTPAARRRNTNGDAT